MTANPSDPSESITGFKLVKAAPKKGASGPNNIETKIETATTKPSILVTSQRNVLTLSNIAYISSPYYKKKKGVPIKAPFHLIAKLKTYLYRSSRTASTTKPTRPLSVSYTHLTLPTKA